MQDSLANFVKPVARPVEDGQGTGEHRSWEEKQVIVKQRIIELQALWNLPLRPGPADGRPAFNWK